MSNKIVSIIIVAAGTRGYLKSCLDSIGEQAYPSKEIIVIDNSLNRDFEQEFRQSYPEIKLYPSRENLSYCQALNKGIGVSKGDFILCLNDDVVLGGDYIEKALKAFDIDQRIGMASGKILRSNGKTIDSTGLSLNIWRTATEKGYGLMDVGQFEKPGFIFGVTGAVALYRRPMLEEINVDGEYFDQDFRFFYEDLDIAWRAENRGWKGYYIPGAVAYHVRGGTARKDKGINKKYARRYLSQELLFDLTKNRYLVIIKNEAFLNFLLHLPFILYYDMISWGYILFFKPGLIKMFLGKQVPIASAFRKRRLLKNG